MLWSRTSRPDHSKWKPHSNAGDSDRVAAYEIAAQQLGISIKVGFPVPCPIGADYAAQCGHKGIYVLRSDAEKADKLTDEMFNALRKMSD